MMFRGARLLAVVATVGIVLPPAWCCIALIAAGTTAEAWCFQRASYQSPCCRHRAAHQPGPGKIPGKPNQLCVLREAPLLAKRVQQSQSTTAIVPLAIARP